jgi:hypothetical protein
LFFLVVRPPSSFFSPRDRADRLESAREDLTETRQDAREGIQEDRQELAEARQEMPGQPIGDNQWQVNGRVTGVRDDGFEMETADGENLDLEYAPGAAQPGMIQEGAQVRTSYMVQDGEKIAQQVEVIGQAPRDEDDRQHRGDDRRQMNEQQR